MLALKTSQSESRISVGLDLSIDISAHINKRLDSLSVSIHSGEHKGRNAEFRTGTRVDLGAMHEQELNDLHMSTGRSERQRGVIGDIPVLLVGLSLGE